MYQYKSVIIFVFCTAFVLLLSVDAKSQEAEIETLVKDISIDSQKGAISSYTYFVKLSYERHRKLGGRKFTRFYEAILPSRFSLTRTYQHPFLLLRDSERAITDEQIMNSRKEIAKELEKAENEEDKKLTSTENLKPDGGYWTIGFSSNQIRVKVDILELLKNSRLSNLQRKQIDGRAIVLIEFLPKADAVFEKSLSYLSKIEGQIWIDEADKRIIRVEGFAADEFAKQKDKTEAERQKEMVFLFLQAKVAEGFWFPQTVRLNFEKHPEVFETIEVEFNFSSYKRANVDVKDMVDKPKEPTTEPKTEEKQN